MEEPKNEEPLSGYEGWKIDKELRELFFEERVKQMGKLFWIGLGVFVLIMYFRCKNQAA